MSIVLESKPPHQTLSALFADYGLFKSDPNWRLTPRVAGEIHGLPGSFGTLVATNGVLCLIEQSGRKELFEGHLDFFIPQKDDDLDTVVSMLTVKKPNKKTQQMVEDLEGLV